MADKRINKILWHGNELDDEGRAKAPSVAEGSDGLDGLNDGEVYICNADEDPAMFIRTDAGRVARVGGGSAGDTYTKDEINQKLSAKVDTAFFSRLFGLMTDTGEEIAVNDVNAAGSSIHAKFGLYTEQFLSALGLNPDGSGGGGGGATTLGELANVGEWADEVPQADRVMVQLAGATHWSSKPLSELVGLDEEALADYLAENKYATQSWVTGKGYATTASMNSSLAGKVDKVSGKGLSSNDFTDALLTKLNGIEEGANKYVLPTATGSVLGGVKVGATLAIASGVLNMKAVGTAGTYTKVTVDAYGRVTGHASLAATDIPNLPWSKITSGKPTTLAGYGITDAYTKTETNTKLSAKLDKATFEELFEKVELSDGTFAIHAKLGLYTDGFLSALGLDTETSGGGGGTSYDRLDAWADYSAEKAGWVLSAALGEDLNTRVAALEGGAGKVSLAGITDLHSTWDALLKAAKPATLAGYGIEDAYTKSAADGRYVLKTGDTITGNLSVMQIILQNSNEINSNVANGTLYLAYRGTTGGVNLCNNNAPLTYGSAKYAILHAGNYTSTLDSRYVKKSGDTMTGKLIISTSGRGNQLLINNTAGGESFFYLQSAGVSKGAFTTMHPDYGTCIFDSTSSKFLGIKTNGTPHFQGDTLWHAGNDGSGSGLDADTVDGYHSTSFSKRSNINIEADTTVNVEDFVKNTALTGEAGTMLSTTGWAWADSAYIKLNDSYTVDRMRYSILSYRNGSVNNTWNQQALMFLPTYYENKEIYLVQMNTNATADVVNKYVKRYTDYDTILASNVASATKLQTVRKIWGQSFNGEADVSGNMTGVGSITASGNITTDNALFQIDATNISGDRGLNVLYNGQRLLCGFGTSGSKGLFITHSGSSPGWILSVPSSTVVAIAQNSGINVGIGTTSPSYKLHVAGTGYFSGALSTASTLAVTGNATLNGLITCNNNIVFNQIPIVNTGARYLYFGGNYEYGRIGWEDSTNFYIQGVSAGGTMHLCARNMGKLAVIDMQADSVNLSDNLTAQGTIYSKIGVYSDGYMSCLGVDSTSDARLKEVLRPVRISLEAMANAPAVAFRWKSGRGEDIGGLAQYWQGVEPLAVKAGKEGWLTMNYAGLAYVLTVSLAGELLALRDEVRTLREEVRQMKANRAA